MHWLQRLKDLRSSADLITAENRWHYFVGVHAFILIAYMATNRFPLTEPMTLEKTWLDLTTPFLPWTIWIYVSFYASFMSVYLWEKDLKYLSRFVLAFIVLNIVSNVIFILFPTTYDRSVISIPADTDPLTRLAIASLHLADSPGNCLPSLHVANTFMAAFHWLGRFASRFWGYFVWAVLVAVSTLTVKQHYAYDIAAGFFLAFVTYAYFSDWRLEKLKSAALFRTLSGGS